MTAFWEFLALAGGLVALYALTVLWQGIFGV